MNKIYRYKNETFFCELNTDGDLNVENLKYGDIYTIKQVKNVIMSRYNSILWVKNNGEVDTDGPLFCGGYLPFEINFNYVKNLIKMDTTGKFYYDINGYACKCSEGYICIDNKNNVYVWGDFSNWNKYKDYYPNYKKIPSNLNRILNLFDN